jgi:hypothetical protein
MVDENGAWTRQGEAFWRAIFKAEPQPPERKLLYRRRGLCPPLSPLLSPGAYSSSSAGPIVPRPREGHRRRFSEADKHQILDQAGQDGASAAEIARRYGIDSRVLRRWKQELAAATFVTAQITDAETVSSRRYSLQCEGAFRSRIHRMRKGIDGLAMLVQGVLQSRRCRKGSPSMRSR